MTLVELFGCSGLLCGTVAGLIVGWSHSPIVSLGGAVFGALLGWVLGVFFAHILIVFDSPKPQNETTSETNPQTGPNEVGDGLEGRV